MNNTQDQYNKALKYLRDGGVIAYPTDTTYGIGCDATNLSAVKKIFELKGRDINKPLSLAFSNLDMLKKFTDVSKIPDRILKKLFPGPVTILLPKNELIADAITAGSPKVGARIPDYHKILELIEELGKPIITTSANPSGEADPVSADEITLPVDFIVSGECKYKKPSTIIDIEKKVLIRVGANADYYAEFLSNIG